MKEKIIYYIKVDLNSVENTMNLLQQYIKTFNVHAPDWGYEYAGTYPNRDWVENYVRDCKEYKSTEIAILFKDPMCYNSLNGWILDAALKTNCGEYKSYQWKEWGCDNMISIF